MVWYDMVYHIYDMVSYISYDIYGTSVMSGQPGTEKQAGIMHFLHQLHIDKLRFIYACINKWNLLS